MDINKTKKMSALEKPESADINSLNERNRNQSSGRKTKRERKREREREKEIPARELRVAVRSSICYTEKNLNNIVEESIVPLKKSKKRSKWEDSIYSDSFEASIAGKIGLSSSTLSEEEIESGVVNSVGGLEQSNYIVVRNHILAKWRCNSNKFLEFSQVMETIRSEHASLAKAAYNFLFHHGYVNFGVSPAIKNSIPYQSTKSSVIVIGAGLAGLAAARQLLLFGHKVVIIEGRLRPGGRVHTKTMEAGGFAASADLGGSVITGAQGNPLSLLACQLGLSFHKIRDTCPLYDPDGNSVDESLDSKVEKNFNWMLDHASQIREEMSHVAHGISLGTALECSRRKMGMCKTPQECQLLEWHLANLEYANAARLSDLSLAFWDQDDPYELGGDHCFLAGGNGQLVEALAQDLPLFLGCTVDEVRYGDRCEVGGVEVICSGPGGQRTFRGDVSLCTLPLGVLKKNVVRFEPLLPNRKLEAISRLGFGLLNKVALLFSHSFWGTELDTFGRLVENPSSRGEFFLFYSYSAVAGGPLLLALVAGEAAHEFEQASSQELVAKVMKVLRSIFDKQGIVIPLPLQAVCTRWKSDPFAHGSYSNVLVGSSGEDYDIMAENVDGRLFFAGEATIRRYPATMHGALLSGLREAANIEKMYDEHNTPHKPSVSRHQLQEQTTLLEKMFGKPNLEFGCFAVVWDPISSTPDSIAILRLTFLEGSTSGNVKGGTNKSSSLKELITSGDVVSVGLSPNHGNCLKFSNSSTGHPWETMEPRNEGSPFEMLIDSCGQRKWGVKNQIKKKSVSNRIFLYAVVTRHQVELLQDVRGGDDARLQYLTNELNVKLVGRRGLGMDGERFLNQMCNFIT